MESNMLVGANIRYERKLRNLTIDELAEIVDITLSHLGLIERGQKGITIKNLCKLADFFSISIDTMLNRDIEGLTKRDEFSSLYIKREKVKNQIETLNETEINFINATLNQLAILKNHTPDER
ncbi:MAG: helix-turn-helix transcriptional regulator [Clostridiales bacterium]|nr:helix-turn-helix transcriptional regulator [Clostridiales bacterium]